MTADGIFFPETTSWTFRFLIIQFLLRPASFFSTQVFEQELTGQALRVLRIRS